MVGDAALLTVVVPLFNEAQVLKEFHLAKAQIDTDHNNAKYRDAETEIMYSAILKKEGIDPRAFAYSYDYYLDAPVKLDTIYARLIRGMTEQMNEEENAYGRSKMTDPATRAGAPPEPAQPLPATPEKTQKPASSPAFQSPNNPPNQAR